MFNNIYNDKKILITGHTGFKGSWLTIWLLNLGANIVGISKDIPTNPSMFVETKLEDKIMSYQINLNDLLIFHFILNKLFLASSGVFDFLIILITLSKFSTDTDKPIKT